MPLVCEVVFFSIAVISHIASIEGGLVGGGWDGRYAGGKLKAG